MSAAYRDRVAMILAFARTRWGLRFRTREQLLAFQDKRITRFLEKSASRSDFYRTTADLPLERQPIVDKRTVLAAFSAFNVCQIDLAIARAVAFQAERDRDFEPTLPGGITVGASTGTSGEPTVFLVSSRERSVWAGVVLARMLTRALMRRLMNPFSRPVRIAFFLRADSNLYQTLGSSRVRFEFFDLLHSLAAHAEALSRFAPDILVAPPSVLRQLAAMQAGRCLAIHPQQVISVAETLEDGDESAIQAAWSIVPCQIYQCTEGFLGYSCAHGSIHLNEEFVHIELEPLTSGDDRFIAVITDFCRTTQLFVRFRMDDVLRVDPTPCPCGRVTVRLKGIEGRQDDILWLPAAGTGTLTPVFPDQVRRAMMLASPSGGDYRIEQQGSTLQVALRSSSTITDSLDWARVDRELLTLWQALELQPPRVIQIDFPVAGRLDKRRRIRCVSKPPDVSPDGLHTKLAGLAG